MDLPVIGAHCSVKQCNDLDFLPIKCACEQLFCRHHIFPDVHSCSVAARAQDRSEECPPTEKRAKCAMKGCSKHSLASVVLQSDTNASDATPNSSRVQAVCGRCGGGYCAEHRYPEAHNCTVPDSTPAAKNVEAHALLRKHFSKASTSSPTNKPASRPAKPPKDPAKLEAYKKIELIKMRRLAQPGEPGGPSVGLQEKVFVKVSTMDASKGERIFWFRKNIGTGRALDLLVNEFGLPASQSHQLLQQTSDTDEQTPLRNDRLLGEEISEVLPVMIVPIPTAS